MAKVTPEGFADKHAKNLKGSLEYIRQGVDRVTVSPGEQAAAKVEKMRTNFNAAIDSGKTASRLRSVTLEDWKTKMKDKGVARIPQGVDAARAKVVAFAGQLLPHIDSGVSRIKAMPDLTLEDSIARMSEFTRHMAKFKRS